MKHVLQNNNWLSFTLLTVASPTPAPAPAPAPTPTPSPTPSPAPAPQIQRAVQHPKNILGKEGSSNSRISGVLKYS